MFKKKRLIKGIGANAIDKTVILSVQLLMVPFLVMNWGKEVYGIWLMLAAVPSLLAFSDLGFATAAGTLMAMEVAAGRRDEAARTYASMLHAMLIVGTCILLISAAILWLGPSDWYVAMPGYTSVEVRLTILFLVMYGIACLQNTASFAGFRSDGLMHYGVLLHTAIYTAESATMIATVVAGGSPVWAAGALLLGRILGVTMQNRILKRKLPWLKAAGNEHINWHIIRELISPANAMMAVPVAQSLMLQGTAVILGTVAGPAAVPAFAAARTLSRIGLQVSQLVSTAIMPEFSAAAARGEGQIKARLLLLSVLVSGLITIPYCIIFGIFGVDLISIWTSHEIAASPSLIVYMATTVFFGGIWMPLSNLLVAINRQASFSYIFLLLGILSIPLSYVLAGWIGAAGSALTLVVVDGLMAIRVIWLLPIIGIRRAEMHRGLRYFVKRAREIFAGPRGR